jgi:hypothetical protein
LNTLVRLEIQGGLPFEPLTGARNGPPHAPGSGDRWLSPRRLDLGVLPALL